MRAQKHNCPLNRVLHALALGLSSYPKFKVLKPVVVFDAIDVMDIFVSLKRSAQVFFHNFSMLKNRFSSHYTKNIAALFLSKPSIDIFSFVPRHAGPGAGNGAISDSTVWLTKEGFRAKGASLFNKCHICARVTLALFRAVDAPLSVSRLCKKRGLAMWAHFCNWGRSGNAASPSVNSAWHIGNFRDARVSTVPKFSPAVNVIF